MDAQRLVPSIPTFDLETPRQAALLLLGLGRILATAMDTVAGGIAPRVQFLGGGLLLVPVLLFGAILALAGVATVAWAIAAVRSSASHAA